MGNKVERKDGIRMKKLMGNRGWKCVRERERGESEKEIKVKRRTGMRITVDEQ